MRLANQHPIQLLDLLLFPVKQRRQDPSHIVSDLKSVRQERLFLLLQPMAIINLVNSVSVALYVFGHVGVLRTAIWILPIWLFAILQLLKGNKVRPPSVGEKPSGRALQKVGTGAFFFGAWWSAPVLLYADAPEHVVTFLYFMATGMTAGVAAICVGLTGISSRFMAGYVAVLLCAQIATPLGPSMIVAGLVLCGAVAFSALNNDRLLVRDVENDQKVKEISESRSAALEAFPGALAYYESNGDLIIANKYHLDRFRDAPQSSGTDGLHQLNDGTWVLTKTIRTQNGRTLVVQSDVSDLILAQEAAREALSLAEESEASVRRFAKNITASIGGEAQQMRVLTSGLTILRRHPGEIERMLKVAEDAGRCAANISDAFEDLHLLVSHAEGCRDGALMIENLSQCCADAVASAGKARLESAHRLRIFGDDAVMSAGYMRPVLLRMIGKVLSISLDLSETSVIEIGAVTGPNGDALIRIGIQPVSEHPDQLSSGTSCELDQISTLRDRLAADGVSRDLFGKFDEISYISEGALFVVCSRQLGRVQMAVQRFQNAAEIERSLKVFAR